MNHARATDDSMTTLQRALRWWKEYGAALLSLSAILLSGLLWYVSKTGFAVIG